MNNVESQMSNLAGKILQQLQNDLGAVWTERLSQADQDLVAAVSSDAAAVVLEGLAGSPEQAAREKAQVDAQLLNVTSAATIQVNQRFWASVGAVIKTALGFAITFA